jgi:hypothetical protein
MDNFFKALTRGIQVAPVDSGKRHIDSEQQQSAKRSRTEPPVQHNTAPLVTRLQLLHKHLATKSDEERALQYVPPITQLYTNGFYRRTEARGDEMLKYIEQTIKGFFPKGRFGFQVDLHNQILRATLRQTLGENYRRLVQRVCKERGWNGAKKNLFTIASRRSGKTTGIASMVAALLICVPKMQIVVYSVAKRSAEEFVRLVESYIQLTPVGRGMIKNPGGAEMLVLNGTKPGDQRRIRSFPTGGNATNVSIVLFRNTSNHTRSFYNVLQSLKNNLVQRTTKKKTAGRLRHTHTDSTNNDNHIF